jgi:gluconolactonase
MQIVRLARTGRPNGLALDREGTIWVAESYPDPALLRMQIDGRWQVVASACDGEDFLFPNDLCFGPDGMLYLTDSGIPLDEFAPGGQLSENYSELPYDGRIYRIDPRSGGAVCMDSGIKFTNGIAFDDDGYLYVNEMIGGAVYRYRVDLSGVGERDLFGNVVDPALEGHGPFGFRGPDGMKFGADGRLYVTVFGQQDVTILSREGQVEKRLRTEGRFPSNLAFGPPGSRRLYVTEGEFGTMEILDVDTDGAPLHG